MLRELPEGWELKRLGDIAKIQAGGTPRRGVREYWTDGTIPWVKISDIREKYIETTSECITDLGLKDSSAKIFPKGTILLSIFATLGDIGILKIDATCNQAIAGIIVEDKNVDPDYLYYVLKNLKAHFEQIGRGVAQNNINQSILKDTIIPHPPLSAQRQIVAVLEQAEAVKRQRQEADELTGALLQGVFTEMFGDPVRNEKGWEKKTLHEILSEDPQNGLYKPMSEYGDDGTPIIRIDSFYDGKIGDFSNLKRIRCNEKEIAKYLIHEGDVLINRVNSLEFLGKCGLVPKISEDIIYECNMIRVKPNQSVIDPIFLTTFLCSRYVKNQILNSAKNAVNQSSINQQDVKALAILVPPLALQQQFARVVERVERIRDQQLASGKEIEGLCEGLMARVFAGELVG